MTRKIISTLLIISMAFCILGGYVGKQTANTITVLEKDGFDITLTETNDRKRASTTVEGIPIKCEHMLSTNEYWLYLEDEPIQLEINVNGNNVEISTVEELNTIDYSEKIVGQFTLTLFLATPAFIAAAKALICAIVSVTLTATIFISADLIGDTIGSVRNKSSTYTQCRVYNATAADTIRFGRRTQEHRWYKAYLSNNAVMVGAEISSWEAINRLKFGQDVFATTAFAAGYVALQASTSSGKYHAGTPHSSHTEGGYPHYHACGRRWVNNRDHSPHAWYPYN